MIYNYEINFNNFLLFTILVGVFINYITITIYALYEFFYKLIFKKEITLMMFFENYLPYIFWFIIITTFILTITVNKV